MSPVQGSILTKACRESRQLRRDPGQPPVDPAKGSHISTWHPRRLPAGHTAWAGVLLLAGFLAGCDEASTPSGSEEAPPARLVVDATTRGFGTSDPASPNTLYLGVRDEAGNLVREITTAFSENPDRSFGPYDLDVGGAALAGISAEAEIAQAVGDARVVVWSGEASGIVLEPGVESRVTIEFFRGSLEARGLSGISITGSPEEMAVDESVPLGVSAQPGGISVTPAWGSLDPTVISVDPDGVVRAHTTGSARIVAAAGPVADTVQIVSRPLVASVEVSPESHRFTARGRSLVLEATVRSFRHDLLPGHPVSWSSSDPSVVRVDTTGRIVAAGPGVATIEARAGEIYGSATITVAPEPDRIRIDPSEATLTPGETVALSARVLDAEGFTIPGVDVTWASSDPEVATVSTGGMVQGVGLGSTIIQVSHEGLSAGSTVHVVAGAVDQIVLVSGGDQAAAVGTTLPSPVQVRVLDAAGFPVEGAEVEWAASGSGSALHSSTVADPSGLTSTQWTLGATAGPQSLTVSSGSASLEVTATAVPVGPGSVAISPSDGDFTWLGQARSYSASVLDLLGNPLPLEPVSWTTTDPAVATVDTAGVVTATGTGVATLVASAGTVADSLSLSVIQVPDSIVVSPDSVAVEPGESTSISAVVLDAGGSTIPGASVDWNSSMPALASVDSLGTVRGEAEGTAVVTATAGGVSGSAFVAVTAPSPATLEIVSGNAQSAPAGTILPDSVVVRVLSPYGHPVPGTAVTFAAGGAGAVDPAAPVADSLGRVQVRWTLGSETGAQALEAMIPTDTLGVDATATGASRIFDASVESDAILLSDPEGAFTFPDDDWTLSLWVRPDDLSLEEFQIALSTAADFWDQGITLYLSPALGMNWTIAVGGSTNHSILFGGATATEGSWQHLVIRRSGDSVRLWSDGVEFTGDEILLPGDISPTATPMLGAPRDGTQSWYTGGIAQITRWDAALTPAEIQGLAGGSHPLTVAEASRRWFLPLGRSPETVVGANLGITVGGTTAGGAPPVDPPPSP